MVPSPRIVMQIPMTELWNSTGDRSVVRVRALGHRDIVDLLRQEHVRFVVAECGEPLQWIPCSNGYGFWKAEVKPRIVETETFDLADFPGNYCYVASEWADGQPLPIVLLEMYH